MPIPFTQYMRPNGRKVQTDIDMPKEVEKLANEFIEAGGWFESEHLQTGHVSLTACWDIEDEGPSDIAIEVVPNGPLVTKAVEKLVETAYKYAMDHPPV